MTPSDFLGLAIYLAGIATAFALMAWFTWAERAPPTTDTTPESP